MVQSKNAPKSAHVYVASSYPEWKQQTLAHLRGCLEASGGEAFAPDVMKGLKVTRGSGLRDPRQRVSQMDFFFCLALCPARYPLPNNLRCCASRSSRIVLFFLRFRFDDFAWKAFSTAAGFDKKRSQAVMQFAAFVKAEFEEAGPQVMNAKLRFTDLSE